MTDEEITLQLRERLEQARKKHPAFAKSLDQALLALGAEYGEALQEPVKKGPCWKGNMEYELIDLIVVAWRMLRGEYE